MKKQLIIVIVILSILGLSNVLRAQSFGGGQDYSLSICTDHTVMSWGYNQFGQLGNSNYSTSNVPIQVNLLTGITAVSAGRNHALALKNDGTVWAWGRNAYGELGNGNVFVNTFTEYYRL